ncbi:MAG: hypothetical protein AB3N21_13780 [Ruegeria sp.]|uniref:hypothetical protein n=1 Tax=Ruegeria sp. TaxID=1879320 RepID=UPI00349EAC8C
MAKKRRSLLDVFNVQSAFFIPVWRRALVVTACVLWAIVELANGNPFWAVLFGAIAAYCAHQFFIVFDPVDKED